MKKCKEKVDQVCFDGGSFEKVSTTAMKKNHIVQCAPSSIISGRSSHTFLAMLSAVLCLSVITTHLLVAAQLAQPIQQISAYSNDPSHDRPSLKHGGNLYAPQHGYDNNIEFIHDQTESIYEVPSQLDSNSNNDQHEDHNPEDHQNNFDTLPASDGAGNDYQPPSIGAGDTYLHNGAPELEADADLHHRHHHLSDGDESVHANQLPDDDDRGEVNSEFTELDGGIIVGQKILRQSESPYVLNTDLEVEKGGVLNVEPGVTIEFAPMVGITVRGVINAVVSEEGGGW